MTTYIVSQILGNLPAILVLLAGGIAAIVFIQRAQTAAYLTLAGVALMLFAIVVQVTVNIGVTWSRGDQMWYTMANASRVLMGLLNAVSLGLLLAAVFVGRGQPAMSQPQYPNQLK